MDHHDPGELPFRAFASGHYLIDVLYCKINMIRMNINKVAQLAIAAGILAGCASPPPSAPIVDRSAAARPVEAAKPRPVIAERRGYYTVKRGDTLYRIAAEFGQNFRDLVTWNNLASPNDIKVDQVLRVLPPEPGSVPEGAQTSSVASGTGIEVRPLGTPSQSAAANAPAPTNKTVPRGDKRPFSEAALAELQKQDGAPSTKADEEKERSSESSTKPADANEGAEWIWPAEGKLISRFESGKKGIDIAGKIGQPILAAGSGTVLYAGRMRGYGNLVIVKHSGVLLSAYAHAKTILVKEGQTVAKGQRIAEMGNSDTDAVKLHFEIRQQGKPVDPLKFLPSQ